MDGSQINALLAKQRAFFQEGFSDSQHFKVAMLDTLEAAIKAWQPKILDALYTDLGKSAVECLSSEIAPVLHELRYLRNRVRRWSARHFMGSAGLVPGRAYVQARPYGTTLIMSPWNYPFQLAMSPLVTAIAAGNTVLLKPSEQSPATSAVLADMISAYFENEFIAVVQGDATVAQACLAADFDMVFFTGSTALGRIVATSCAARLIPCVLELGGKSPVVLLEDADLTLAARRIVWGKIFNAGQTCVAPDHVWVQSDKLEAFVEACQEQIKIMLDGSYSRIINQRHFDRLLGLLSSINKPLINCNRETLHFEPVIAINPSLESQLMQEEIFGPILPIISYNDLAEVDEFMVRRPSPLAFYVFGSQVKKIRDWMRSYRFGGGCINDVILHVNSSRLPFGGVGASGMGRYHGKAGFEAFSYTQAIVEGSKIDISMRYPPVSNQKEALFRRLLR